MWKHWQVAGAVQGALAGKKKKKSDISIHIILLCYFQQQKTKMTMVHRESEVTCALDPPE
jgi:hypothetical protein